MIKYVVLNQGEYHIIDLNGKKEISIAALKRIYSEVYEAPAGITNGDGDLIDIVGGKAVVNSAKQTAKDSARETQKSQMAQKSLDRATLKGEIKNASLNFNNLTTASKLNLLNKLIKYMGLG